MTKNFSAILKGLFISLFCLWVIRVPTAYFLGHHFGLMGVWMAGPVEWVVNFAISFTYWQSGLWKKGGTFNLGKESTAPQIS